MYKVEERDIIGTVIDFDTFCRFVDERKPVLSSRKEVLGKNSLFELNAQLLCQKDVTAPKFMQESYPVVDLIFNLALAGGLFIKTGDAKGNIQLEGTSRKKEYETLNNFEKYCFLLEVFWTEIDLTETMRWDNPIQQLVNAFSRAKKGQELVKGSVLRRDDFDIVFSYQSVFVHYLAYFGLCSFEQIVSEIKKLTKYDDSISKIIPTEFGINLSKILGKLKLTLWNVPYLEICGIYIKDEGFPLTKVPFRKHIEPLFPLGMVINSVTRQAVEVKEGNYTFQVMLEKSVWRKIKLSHNHTLHDLHLAIQDAFDFDNDHLYSFFMDGKRYSRNAYHNPFGDEEPFADEAVIGELGLYLGQKILYLFDYGDSWEFKVLLNEIGESETELEEPEIIESKGEAPPQYPDWDDYDEEEE